MQCIKTARQILTAPHKLPVSFRMDFKVLPLVFKALNGLRPAYLTDWLSIYTPWWVLRSYAAGLLKVTSQTPENVLLRLLILPLNCGGDHLNKSENQAQVTSVTGS